jgi:hypothetical protein
MKECVEKYRVVLPNEWGTVPKSSYGLFFIPSPTDTKRILKVICAPMEDDWQHVSVSLPNRCPNWTEMSYIKDLFWEDEDTVIQFHPKKTHYINNHPYVLHLWKKSGEEIELPPSILVGLKDLENESQW